jgi:hypothetical protein
MGKMAVGNKGKQEKVIIIIVIIIMRPLELKLAEDK